MLSLKKKKEEIMRKCGDRNSMPQRFRFPRRALLLVALASLVAINDFGVLRRTEGQSSGTCNITYKLNTQWNVGFQAELTIVNNGPAINGWTVTWTFPSTQSIYELWNGIVTQSGANVTVRNASYNANIPTGGSVSFGFNANWFGSNPAPTSFALNGVTCGGSTPSIATSVTTLSVNEGGSAQFGVRLTAAPAANVTVSIAKVSGDADLNVSGGATLTFTPANFGAFQNVTISAAEDADQTNGTAIFRASAPGLNTVDVNANESDNDIAAIAINTSVTTLSVNEGATAQFGVRLSAAPAANVTVNITKVSGDADLNVSAGATLTFTPANFGTFQNVTISAAEDADQTNGAAVFRASGTGVTSADVNVNESDNDIPPNVITTSVASLTVNEGATGQFGVRLSAAPAANVTVAVARQSGDTDLTVTSGASLTFTPANFSVFQNVTISAGQDADQINGTAVFRASATGLTSADVNVTESDNDIAINTSVTTLNVVEGATAQFGVRLSAAPLANVTVSVTRISGDADLTVSSGGTLTFTPANFGAFQNVTIAAAEDVDLLNGAAVFRAAATGLTSADVNVGELDNDPAILIATNLVRSPLAVIEGTTAQVGFRLATAPAANVTVNVARLSGDANLNVSAGATLTFTPANFSTFQAATISAAEDADLTNGTAVVRASGTGLTSADVNVSEFDNDGAAIELRTFVASLTGAAEVPPVNSTAIGTSTIILSPDETAGLVSLSFSNLTSPQTAAHVHGPADPGATAPGSVLDLDTPLGQISNMLWVFAPVGTQTPASLVAALKAGRLYGNVHSANFPGGEIRGWYFRAGGGGDGDPGGTGGPSDFARFLEQATFGPTAAELTRVQQIGFDAWLNEQFSATPSNYQNLVQLQQGTFVSFPVKLQFFRNAMRGQDQLRQRVALALSQIVVAADVGNQDTTGDPTAMVGQYHDILTRNAFGNYRTLLREMAVSPIMGTYLTLVNSKRADGTGLQPDENFIRELWQLFSIGTFRLNLNGSLQLDPQGRPLETYTIAEIQEGARALTGWIYAPRAGQPNLPENPFNPFAPMIPNEANHDTGSKTLLNGAVIPGGRTTTQDLDAVIDNVFNHPNVGPFIGRQLIQHLVTSNPSGPYIQRVASVFNNNGQGVRGDMRAVIRAVLLDSEARGNAKTDAVYGRLREPALFLTHLFRALNCTGGMWGIPQRSQAMAQNVFSPPSVFSFYQPDFRVVVNGQSILAPPAQLLTTSTIIQRFNLLNDFLFGQIQSGGNPNPTGSETTTVVFDFAPWDQRASNPTQLVDALNDALMHNSMSTAMRQAVIDAVTSVQNNNRLRVQTAIYIIASSMQYQVQR